MQHKFHLLTEYCGSRGDIVDPSGKPTRAFEDCAQQLDGLIASVLEKIK
jgi:protein-tyrosine-phosphatase